MKWLKKVTKSKRFLAFFIPFFLMIISLFIFCYWNHKGGFEIDLSAVGICFVAAMGGGAVYNHSETQRPSGRDKQGNEMIEL